MSNLKKSERTRQEILDIAWSLIAKRGAEISLAEIAKAANMTRQSIYVHFGSRGGLLTALVRRTDEREKIWEAFEAAMRCPTASERFDAILDAWLIFLEKILPVARDLIRLRAKDSEAGDAWADRMQELRQFYVGVMQNMKDNSALSDQWTPEAAADYVWTQSSVQIWGLLTEDCGWSAKAARASIKSTARQVLKAP